MGELYPTHELCGTCRANRGALVTPGGVIYDDGVWRLEHILEPVPMVGWLVLKPWRHVESMADLTDDVAASFGVLSRRVIAVMREVLRPEKVYLCLFAEAEQFAHIHFHLIPRFTDTGSHHRGPHIFDTLREANRRGENLADPAEAARVGEQIRTRLVT